MIVPSHGLTDTDNVHGNNKVALDGDEYCAVPDEGHAVKRFQDTPAPVEAARGEFRVTLPRSDKAQKELGMVVDFADGVTLHVSELQDGDNITAAVNASLPEDGQIKINDFIVEVNGIRENGGKMVAEMEENKDLELVLRRPQQWHVQLSKKGGPLGLDLHFAVRGRSLVVVALTLGSIHVWNAEHADDSKSVKEHDRIMEVNGFSGAPLDLLQEISKTDELDLLLMSPALPVP